MIPSAETVEKLRKLQKYILEEPKRFNLNFWGAHVDKTHIEEDVDDLDAKLGYDLAGEDIKLIKQNYPPCGTVACLAGNVCVMEGTVQPDYIFETESGEKIDVYTFSMDTPELACKSLGITESEGEKLFYLKNWSHWIEEDGDYIRVGWPEDFAAKLKACTPGTPEYAQVAVERIDHYIKTGE